MVKSALQSLWTDRCDIYEYRERMTENKSTCSEEVCVHENIPCRISYEMMRTGRTTEAAVASAMRVKLFCDNEIEIKPGSKIVVRRRGKEHIYKNSGLPALYDMHQEILLMQSEGWA